MLRELAEFCDFYLAPMGPNFEAHEQRMSDIVDRAYELLSECSDVAMARATQQKKAGQP